MRKTFILAALVAAMLTACGKSDVSFATLEEAKQTARANSLWNAQRYRQENVLMKGQDIISRGDSSQMPNCPQGDGWATMEFVNAEKTRVTKVKCSTVSGATGCLEDADFKSKSFASEDGACQPENKVPFPIASIVK